MALFDIFRKKKEKERYERKRQKGASKIVDEKKPEKKEKKPESTLEAKSLKEFSIAPVSIVAPHITEKATLLSERGVYVFKISPRSNKQMVKQAVQELYGVNPIKVNIVNSPSKKRTFRGHKSAKSGYKKAMVYLKKSDKIEL